MIVGIKYFKFYRFLLVSNLIQFSIKFFRALYSAHPVESP